MLLIAKNIIMQFFILRFFKQIQRLRVNFMGLLQGGLRNFGWLKLREINQYMESDGLTAVSDNKNFLEKISWMLRDSNRFTFILQFTENTLIGVRFQRIKIKSADYWRWESWSARWIFCGTPARIKTVSLVKRWECFSGNLFSLKWKFTSVLINSCTLLLQF